MIFRSFRVLLPSGIAYWTVLDSELRVVDAADEFLRHLRFSRDRAESTTESYAGAVALYLRWCGETGRAWAAGSRHLGMFMLWLKHAPKDPSSRPVLPGQGARQVRGPRRVNVVLAAVREFLKFNVSVGAAPAWVVDQLYEVGDGRDLPVEVRGEYGVPHGYAKVRHRLHEPDEPVDRATDEEIVALVRACRSARDRLIVLLMARAGIRRGELVGLRRADLHFVLDARPLGCPVPGSHLHVVRRDNINRASAKSRNSRAVPVDALLMQAHDQYVIERALQEEATDSDFLLVNLFRGRIGAPMRLGAINELLTSLSRRAGLERRIRPHQGRHGFADNVMAAGGQLDELAELLGHESPMSSQPYLHPSHERLRDAVERIPSPRLRLEGPHS
ncbi:tyrosine-type recombinase/integrase [Streptomyces sp. H27-G5]|uniref:tyrosine-type recombinase/integrase n=1 Tax=Streptomyces sp. H27-G5 TaxID=2996698 RepID=UPI002271C9B0|nr:tyrosine-type recombinase/integrase [Streptomyces sp. H27-G5]MCY0922199.1 tyrosine-type recombinase/integrase [Streptomyces sp. H27-G5]